MGQATNVIGKWWDRLVIGEAMDGLGHYWAMLIRE